MSKRRNNKNNAVKKFFRKPIVVMICVALAIVMLCGALGNLTEGFTNFEGENLKENISTLHLNKKNLFFDVIEDETLLDNNFGKATAKQGVITLNYEKADSDENAVTIAENIQIATITLKKGEYTLSAMNKADWKNCYVVGTYNVGGTTHTWYADYENVPVALASDVTHDRTLTLDADTEVMFYIRICEGTKLDNVKVTPVLVEGKNEGNYFAGLLGLVG